MQMTLLDNLITPIDMVLERVLTTADSMFPLFGGFDYFEKMGYKNEFLPGKEPDIATSAFHVALEMNKKIFCVISLPVTDTDLSIDKYNKIREMTYGAMISLLGAVGVGNIINLLKMQGRAVYFIELEYDPNKSNRKE